MKDDNDLIDRAMDAAEAKLLDAPDRETEAAEAQIVTRQSEEPVRSEQQQYQQRERERAPDGKFAKTRSTQISDHNANVELTTESAPATPAAVNSVNPPAFWSTEQKALFAKADPQMQHLVAAWELELQQRLSRAANEGQRGRAFQNRMYEGYEPKEIQAHKAKLQLNGLRDEVDELHRYRAWDSIFETDPYTGISDLMRKNGFSPYDFIAGAQVGPQYQTDPQVEAKLQRLEELEQKFSNLETSYNTQEEHAFQANIEDFKSGVDSRGQVRRPFAQMYAAHITQAQSQIMEIYPHLEFNSALEHAYEYVLNEVSKLHGIPQKTSISTPEKKIANGKKAQAAASSVVGAPRSDAATQKPRARTIDEALDRAEELVYGGR